MIAVPVESRRQAARHARPHFLGVRDLMSRKIPKSVNFVLDLVEAYPRPAAVVALSAIAAGGLFWHPLAAVLASVAATALLMRGAYAARVASLRDRLTVAERDLALGRAHGQAVEDELRRVRSDLAAATSMTLRIPAVEDGQEDNR